MLIGDYFYNLNKSEDVVYDCYWDKKWDDEEKWKGLTDAELYPLWLEIMSSCMVSTKDEVKELQLEIEAENKKIAEYFCNLQGVY